MYFFLLEILIMFILYWTQCILLPLLCLCQIFWNLFGPVHHPESFLHLFLSVRSCFIVSMQGHNWECLWKDWPLSLSALFDLHGQFFAPIFVIILGFFYTLFHLQYFFAFLLFPFRTFSLDISDSSWSFWSSTTVSSFLSFFLSAGLCFIVSLQDDNWECLWEDFHHSRPCPSSLI